MMKRRNNNKNKEIKDIKVTEDEAHMRDKI